MKTSKQSDETQFAIMGKDISQIQKDVSAISIKLEEIKNTRYVTQNEMQMAIKESRDDFARDMLSVTGQLDGIKKVLWLIFSTFGITIVGAIAKSVLKI